MLRLNVATLLLLCLTRTAHSFVQQGTVSPTTTTRPFFRTSSPLAVVGASDNDKDMYQQVKGVIFDIDGTLADSWKLGYDATVVVLERNNIATITQDEYHAGTIWATPERLARHAGLEPGDEGFEPRGEALGKEFDDLYVGLVSTETAGFYPGVENLLTSMPESVALGALTNAAVAYAHAVLEKNCVETQAAKQKAGIYARFGSVRGADNVPKPKPFPEGLYTVCKDLGLEPHECVYIGDSPSDGAAAHAAGMPAIGVLWGSHKEESLRAAPFNHYCSTMEELVSLLPQ